MNCLNTSESQDDRGASDHLMVIFLRQVQTRINFLGQLEPYFTFFGWFLC